MLLLDEPTNHLDLGAKEELAEALEAFDGTAVLISHDRYFLDRAATHVLHVENGEAKLYIGNYSYYLAKREEELEAAKRAEDEARQKAAKAEAAAAPAKPASSKPAKLGFKQERLLGEAEAAVLALEERVKELETALGEPDIYLDHAKAQATQADYEQAKADLEEASLRWMELAEEYL